MLKESRLECMLSVLGLMICLKRSCVVPDKLFYQILCCDDTSCGSPSIFIYRTATASCCVIERHFCHWSLFDAPKMRSHLVWSLLLSSGITSRP